MERFKQAFSILIATAVPAVVSAQDFSGAVTLGYGHTDVSDISENISTASLDGRFGFDAGNGFRFGVDFSTTRIEIDGISEGVSANTIGAYGSYEFSGGVRVGAYAERAGLNIDGLPIDLSATSYGLMAGYSIADAQVGGFVGTTTTDPSLPSGVDIRDFGLSVKYSAAPALTFGASAMRSRISDSVTDVDVDFLGVAGAYTFADAWTVFGGVSRASLDLADLDLTTIGLGASYNLSPALGFASVVSLELARSDASIGGGGSGQLDTVRLGWSFPLGGDTFTVPMNSVADSIMNPRHSAVTSTVLAAF